MEKVVHAFVSSCLDYCNVLYLGLNQHSLSRLQLVQDSAASLLTGTKGREHITPVLIKLHWLPVWYRIHYKVLLYVFKAVHGLSPDYVTDLISVCQSSRYLRSNYQLLLMVPRSRLKCRGDRAFSVAAPRLYLSIRSSPTVGVFQSALKKISHSFLFYYYFILSFSVQHFGSSHGVAKCFINKGWVELRIDPLELRKLKNQWILWSDELCWLLNWLNVFFFWNKWILLFRMH